jgi:hypothetical protein
MAIKILIPANQSPDATVTYNSHLGGTIVIKASGTEVEAGLADEILSKLGFCVQEVPVPEATSLKRGARSAQPTSSQEDPQPTSDQ